MTNFAAKISYNLMGADIHPAVFSLSMLSEVTGRLIAMFREKAERECAGFELPDPEAAGIFSQGNAWFTPGSVLDALKMVQAGLDDGFGRLVPDAGLGEGRTIAFVVRPEAPFEGLGEILFTAACGFNCSVQVPGDPGKMLEGLMGNYTRAVRCLAERIVFTEGRLPRFDGLIAMNVLKNSTAASYLSGRPHLIIDKPLFTVTLTGSEDQAGLSVVAESLCQYFGRSFFSTGALRVPAGYDFSPLFGAIQAYGSNALNHRYFNHYEYHKSVFLINGIEHFDNGFLLFTPDQEHTGKTSVVTYSYYEGPADTGLMDEPTGGENRVAGGRVKVTGMVEERHRLFYNAPAIAGFLSRM